MAIDLFTLAASESFSKNYTDQQIQTIAKGMEYKGSVATVADLPLTGNKIGYVYTVTANTLEYVWTKDAATGVASDWESLGGGSAAVWGNISGTLADQTDLNTALEGKLNVQTSGANYSNVNQINLYGYETNDGVTTQKIYIARKDPVSSSIALRTEGRLQVANPVNDYDATTKSFVNSSIATNTAYYISDNGQPFTSVAALEAYSGTVTNNDYAFVTGTDESGNTYYDRYKATVASGTTTWAKEYRLNNSSFTAAQWAAIESGVTAALLTSIQSDITGKLDKKAYTDIQTNFDTGAIYGVSSDGSQVIYKATRGTATIGTIAVRTTGGRLIVGTPTDSSDATTKAYVDGLVGDIEATLQEIRGV